MEELNNEINYEFSKKIKFGIGVHAGNTIVGMMGYGSNVSRLLLVIMLILQVD